MPHHASSPGPASLFDAGAASRLLGPAPGDDLERKTQDGRLARVLVVDDDAEAAGLLRTELSRLPLDVHAAASGEEAVQALRNRPVDVVIADLRTAGADGLGVVRAATRLQPPAKVIVITGSGSGTSPAEAAQAGAFDCVRKPFDVEALARVMQRALRAAGRSCTLGLPGGEDGQPRSPFGDLVGDGPEMQAVFRFIERVAGSDISVLITGESGTGKELVAKAIHRQSPRRRGANHAMTVDFRVIAASNKDLRARVACGRFREDLFFRLNVASDAGRHGWAPGVRVIGVPGGGAGPGGRRLRPRRRGRDPGCPGAQRHPALPAGAEAAGHRPVEPGDARCPPGGRGARAGTVGPAGTVTACRYNGARGVSMILILLWLLGLPLSVVILLWLLGVGV